MSKILPLLLSVSLLFSCKPKSDEVVPVDETGCRQLSYKVTESDGSVSTEEVYTYNTLNKLIEMRNLEFIEKYEYDKKGVLIRKITARLPDMKKFTEIDYSYNSRGQLIKEVQKTIDPYVDKYNESHQLFSYYANGRLKQKEWFVPAKATTLMVSHYNEQGLIILEETHDGGYKKLEYNSTGKITRTVFYSPSLDVNIEALEEYNAKDLLVKYTLKNNNVTSHYINYEYNAENKETGMYVFYANGEFYSKKITEYTGENYIVREYNAKNELTSRTEFELKNGLIVKALYYKDDILQYTQTFAYDEGGNKIRDELKLVYEPYPRLREWAYVCN